MPQAVAAQTLPQATAPARCRIPDFPAPELCVRAGLDTLRATYIVLLDESGSMRPIWSQVRSAVGTFVRAVPEGDVLDVRLFSSGVRRLNAPAAASPRLVSEWERQLATLPAPTGSHTDLGAALEQALAAIAAAPADRQHFVYILTDGAQDPVPGSPYPAAGGGGWPELQARARALVGSRPVSFAILRLTDAADAQGLLASSLPRADVVSAMTSEELRRWFETEARSIAVRKLQLRIREERQRPALLDSSASPLRLGASIDAERIQLRQTVDAALVDSTTIALPGGAQLTVHPSAGSDAARLSSSPPPRRWFVPPIRVAGSIDTTIPVRVRLEPATELGLIGVETGPVDDSLRVTVPIAGASAARVVLWWVAAAALAALLSALLVRARQATHRARLTGRLRLERPGVEDEVVELAPLATGSYPIRSPSGRTLAKLEARNERGRTAIWVLPDSEPVMVGGRALRTAERIRTAVRLDHREATVHYFPS